MIRITTLGDIRSLKGKVNSDITSFLQDRFKQLHKTYCSNGLVPLEQFCLEDYGEILVAESYSDVENKLFEDVSTVKVNNTVIYFATWVKNNDVCCDVIIPQAVLTHKQIELIEKEL